MADEQRMQEMSEVLHRMMDEFFSIQCRYSAAMKEVQTKLEILDDEFQMKHRRNPIHHIESRLKSIQSIMEKLRRKQFSLSMDSATEKLRKTECRRCKGIDAQISQAKGRRTVITRGIPFLR